MKNDTATDNATPDLAGPTAAQLAEARARLQADRRSHAEAIANGPPELDADTGALAAAALQALAENDAALARLDDGTYGTCTACGGSIPWARLETIPAAATCVACAGRPAPMFG